MLGSVQGDKGHVKSSKDPAAGRGLAVGPRSRVVADSFAVRHHLLPLTAATSPPAFYLDKDIFDVRLDHPIADDVIKTCSGACDLCGSVQKRVVEYEKSFSTYVRRS